MADIHPSPVPSASAPSLPGPGPEFPSSDPGVMAAANAAYSVPGLPASALGIPGDVLADASGGPLQESGYAHDLNAGTVAPYSAGAISPVYVGGGDDAGGRDIVAGTVAGAVAAAEARFVEHEADTHAQGSTIGDLMPLPPSPLDPGIGSLGITSPSGGFYDPPRNY